MSHDRGCHCGREKYEYDECQDVNCANKITNYLENGGLFNPELMDHDKVSDLLIDCREKFMNKRKKCIVFECLNHSDEGTFIGDMCYPCHKMITTGVINRTNSFIGKLHKMYEVKSKNHAETLAELSKVNVENIILKEQIKNLSKEKRMLALASHSYLTQLMEKE